MPKKETTQIYDLIIVGTGLVGLTLANLLKNSSLKILLVDRCAQPSLTTTNKPSGRIHAYNLTSQRILTDINVWHQIDPQEISPFTQMTVLPSQHNQGLSIHACELNEAHLGHFISSEVVISALLKEATAANNIDLAWDIHLNKLTQAHDHVVLNHNNGSFCGQLIAGTDGARSWIRQQLPIKINTYPYQQKCIVGFVNFAGSHEQTAWQRFLPSGPLGLLPLNNRYFSLAWSLDSTMADQMMSLDDEAFLQTLFAHRLPATMTQLISIDQRQCFPLTALHCQQYYHHRAILLGDAAHVIHPLAGLGLNLGFQDAYALASLLLNDQTMLSEPNKLLGYYQQQRIHKNAQILHAMTAFKQLYGQETMIAKWLQTSLLQTTAHSKILKKWLGRTATNLHSSPGV